MRARIPKDPTPGPAPDADLAAGGAGVLDRLRDIDPADSARRGLSVADARTDRAKQAGGAVGLTWLLALL